MGYLDVLDLQHDCVRRRVDDVNCIAGAVCLVDAYRVRCERQREQTAQDAVALHGGHAP